jgi:DNA repair protein RadC
LIGNARTGQNEVEQPDHPASLNDSSAYTRMTFSVCTPLGISVHDHIIVGKNGHASLKGMRLI